jgi:thioredoxin 1
MDTAYAAAAPSRNEVDGMAGTTVLDFGTNWCGWCQRAQPLIGSALEGHEDALRHVRVEDGPGRPLGRSFGVKLWPTLVFLRDGREVARVVRPQSRDEILSALAKARAAA